MILYFTIENYTNASFGLMIKKKKVGGKTMIAMQYKITLPGDYDMEIIKKRIKENGYKTDGFKDLLFKCYLIQEKNVDGFENMYAPLYLWKESEGMNKFIFEGYYDNILHSFGWQNINIGIPNQIDILKNYDEAKYLLEICGVIKTSPSLKYVSDSMKNSVLDDSNVCGSVCIYNPDKWRYSKFVFLKNRPPKQEANIYQILHISKG